jgi:copper chaperone CopZ
MSTQTITVDVSGMTCGHCVRSVTEELTAIPGVTDVAVDLVADGVSHVTFTATEPVADDAVAAAIAEAGYVVAPPRALL